VQDEATMLSTAGGKARGGGGGAPEAGEDGAMEEDGAAAAEPRRPGRTARRQSPGRPGQVGEEAAHVPGADGGGPAAWRGPGRRRISRGRRRRRIPWGRGWGRRGRRRSGRMTAAAEEDTTKTMAADRG
jgi:hypothetical protein